MPDGANAYRFVVAALILASCGSEKSQRLAPEEPQAPPGRPVPPGQPVAFAEPDLPKVFIQTKYTAPTGRLVRVQAGGDLQKALTDALPGDILLLEAGATFVGNFVLPKKSGDGWIVIRSSAPDAQLPREGQRITPAYATALPKLVSPNVDPALRLEPGAQRYRIIGVEMTVRSGQTLNYGIVALGSFEEISRDLVPQHLVLDRVYVHGHPTLNLSRCVALNSASTAIIDSYLSECHTKGFDSQAIAGWNGPGPFKIVNNYLEGAGENLMIGGADPAIQQLIPSDIEIRGNHMTKPASWRGKWTVKNLFELKNAERVLVEGNVMENNWVDGQDGFAVVLKSMNDEGRCKWCVTRHVTFRYNLVRNSPGGVNMAGQVVPAEPPPGELLHDVLLRDNLFENIVETPGGTGRLFQLVEAVYRINIDQNTGFASTATIVFDTDPKRQIVVTNNIMTRGQYGVSGSGTAEGNPALQLYTPGGVFKRNAIIGADLSLYPTENFAPSSAEAVAFMDLVGRDYRLSAASPYKGSGTTGRDLGANIEALNRAISGVVLSAP